MKEVFGTLFLVLSSVTNLKEHFIWVHKLFLQLPWNLIKHFLGPEACWKHKFLRRKGNPSREEKFLAYFFS